MIQQYGAGIDAIDVAAAAARGIPVANVPSGPSDLAKAVAEFALFHMIGTGRRFTTLQHVLSEKSVQAPFGASVFDAQVCIVGLGGIGSALARLLRAFDCRVVGVKRTPDTDLLDELGIAAIYPSNQISEAVHNCQGSVLINVARGPVVDENALLAALESGHLAAAGLDVFWDEPVDPTHPVFDREVFATPHCASSCDLFLRGAARVVRGNIERLQRGEPLQHRVN